MSLFRPEVLEHRRDRLHGDVNLAVPVSWQLVGIMFFVLVVAGIIFLSFASYSRIETVTGIIAPKGGLARIVPQRPGIVAELPVSEGQAVGEGDDLALIRTEDVLASGRNSAAEILSSLKIQEEGLQVQRGQLLATAAAQRQQMDSRITGLEAEIAGIDNQIALQERLVASAKSDLNLARGIAERGFISKRDLVQREDVYFNRQQQLSQLRQTRATQRAAIDEARSTITQTQSAAGAQVSAMATQQSDIAQSRTAAEAAAASRLTAPIGGKVTALTARLGQAVAAQEPLMLIVPADEELRAELYVPSAAVGFLKPGQEVRLGLDAFPYERFGTIPARVTTIASAPITQQGANGATLPVFLVTAALTRQSQQAYGEKKSLIAGMTLTARIVTEEQSLLEWLFEPLFAVVKR